MTGGQPLFRLHGGRSMRQRGFLAQQTDNRRQGEQQR